MPRFYARVDVDNNKMDTIGVNQEIGVRVAARASRRTRPSLQYIPTLLVFGLHSALSLSYTAQQSDGMVNGGK